MPTKRISPAVWLGLAIGCPAALAVVLALLPRSAVLAFGSAGFYAVTLAVTAAAFYFARNHWCGLDEAGRAAHRTSWYWGGSFGLAAAAIFAAVLLKLPSATTWLETTITGMLNSRTSTISLAFFYGVLFAGVVQLIGYVGAWLAWWGARRHAD